MEDIVLKPVGQVVSQTDNPDEMPLGGLTAVIEVYPQYAAALKGLEENSHIWVLAWFHKAPRDILRVNPVKVNPDLPEYGVFALRAFARPNPVAMSLAKLEKIEENLLYVSGLDAVGGTPVLDIKPYYENDIVFSPDTPYIRGKDREMRQGLIKKQAIVYHQEECQDLHIAVRMAVIAEDHLGKLNSPDLNVQVKGSLCLGDCIQGISKARLANPPRFSFCFSPDCAETKWTKDTAELIITLREIPGNLDFESLSDGELFIIESSSRQKI